jgi:hypothetical protein
METEIIEVENFEIDNTLKINKTLISQADDLADEHEQFNTHYIVGGRLALYDLLAKILALYKKFQAAPDKKNLLGSMKHKMFHTYKIRVQSNSSDAGILVRYITRADRKTAHVYSRVIEFAVANQISVEQFTKYVQECGGIENIRSLGVNPTFRAQQAESEKSNWDLGWKYCIAREELPFAVFETQKDFSKDKAVSFEYYACTTRKGRRYVVANIPADRAFDERAIQLIGNELSALENADERVANLYDEAMKIRNERWERENPGLAKALQIKEC